MIKCPVCNATLPDGAVHCQFCGVQMGSGAPGPSNQGFVNAPLPPRIAGIRTPKAMPGAPGWVWPAYYGIAAWWVIDGVKTVVSSLAFSKDVGGGFGIIGMIIGAVGALIGLGLILRIEAARGIVNILSFIKILDGALGLVIGFFLTPFLGIWGAIGMLFNALRIATAALMIYLIGETESRAPNF